MMLFSYLINPESLKKIVEPKKKTESKTHFCCVKCKKIPRKVCDGCNTPTCLLEGLKS